MLPRFIVTLLLAPLAASPAADPARYLNDVKYLASEELRGRGTGSPELEKAGAYIARQFRQAGLKPVEGKSYFQEFSVTTNARPGPVNRFAIHDPSGQHELRFQEDFIPLSFSATGKQSGKIVFAGYGITAREYNYDDYAGIDVKDKLVIVLRHEPQEFDEKSVFAGKVYTDHAQIVNKALNARIHGARGVFFVNDTANHPADADSLEKFSRTVGPANPGIVFVQVKAEIAERWIAASGKSLKDIQAAIDKDLRPQSFAFPDSLEASVTVDVEREVKSVHNVAGYLPGETPEYLIVGAHYDHLGLGEQHSLAPSQAGTTPHPGADDNASGTAGVLELAREFARQPKHKRGLLFLAFAGEELGLLGSSFYVNHPAFPLDKAVAMINMDMIGRIRDGKVYIGGAGTGSTFKALLEQAAPRHPLKLDYTEQTGYGSSDHYSFSSRQVPVLFFFSGLHADYHKPSDTWDKIDAPGTAKLLDLVADLAGTLADGAERPQYVRVAEPRPVAVAGSGGSGYGPYFGSIPDFTEIPNGVRFADVRDQSPAAKAGLKSGDILTEFDGQPIKNLYDFTAALRSHKPGDEVAVKVLRESKTIEVKVMLGKRQ